MPQDSRQWILLAFDASIRAAHLALVAGLAVKIGELKAAKGEDLSAWIEGIKAGELPWAVYRQAPRSIEARLAGLPETVTTTADGTFEIRGLGRERIARL